MIHVVRRKARSRPTNYGLDRTGPGRQTCSMAKRDFKRLGKAIEARRGELGLTQAEFADRGGIALKTVSRLENGTADPRQKTLGAVDRAAEWATGTALRITEGVEPADPSKQTSAVGHTDAEYIQAWGQYLAIIRRRQGDATWEAEFNALADDQGDDFALAALRRSVEITAAEQSGATG